MSTVINCKYMIKGDSQELAEFVEKHIVEGCFDPMTLGIDGEYMNLENPYTVEEVLKYNITQLNIWFYVVSRSNNRPNAEWDILEAIKDRYPNLEVNFGYIIDDVGSIEFPNEIIICDDNIRLHDFKIDFGFKLPDTFNKIIIHGKSDDLIEFVKNEIEYGRVKSHFWCGNNFDLEKIAKLDAAEIAIYFEQEIHQQQDFLYEDVILRYPNCHVKMHSLAIKHKKFIIKEKGEKRISIEMSSYKDFKSLIEKYNFFDSKYEDIRPHGRKYIEDEFYKLIFKACEKYRSENDIFDELSLKMYMCKRHKLRVCY